MRNKQGSAAVRGEGRQEVGICDGKMLGAADLVQLRRAHPVLLLFDSQELPGPKECPGAILGQRAE